MTNLEHLKSRLAFPDRPRALRIMTVVFAVATVVNVVVWAAVSAISGDIDSPWFLWSIGPAAVPLATGWWLTAPRTVSAVGF